MNDVFDDWSQDQVDPGELPARLTALADNIPPPLPNQGGARQRRIEKMEEELSDIARFVTDCDRWGTGTRDIQLIGNDVRTLMEGHLAKLRRRAVERGRQLNGELEYIKGQTS